MLKLRTDVYRKKILEDGRQEVLGSTSVGGKLERTSIGKTIVKTSIGGKLEKTSVNGNLEKISAESFEIANYLICDTHLFPTGRKVEEEEKARLNRTKLLKVVLLGV